MKKGLKITGVAVGIALMLTAVLGTTVFADAGDGECDACTTAYAGENGWHGVNGMGKGSMEAVYGLLGLTEDEVHELREEGYSLAEIAEANGVSVDELVEAIMAVKTDDLEARVAEGTLTQERAEQMMQVMEQRTLQNVTRNQVGAPEWRGGSRGNSGCDETNGTPNQMMRGRGGAGMTGRGNGAGTQTRGDGVESGTGTGNRWGSSIN
ncbi:MAG: hypothetical protein JW712_02425 [Dehalococcoidales bacterium]|nr:hypothetical protein [Dehalococcoidales bacterium]